MDGAHGAVAFPTVK